jgi:hypothetical protein
MEDKTRCSLLVPLNLSHEQESLCTLKISVRESELQRRSVAVRWGSGNGVEELVLLFHSVIPAIILSLFRILFYPVDPV